MKNESLLLRVLSLSLALLLLGVLLRSWGLAPGLFRTLTDPSSPPWSVASLTYTGVVAGLLALLGGAVLGLFRHRLWGVYCAYALVPVSTLLLGIPLVPFVSDLLPGARLRTAGVIVLNATFLAATVILHREYRKSRSEGARKIERKR